MKCSKSGKKNGGRMLNENHKGWREQRRGAGERVWWLSIEMRRM